MSVWLTPEGYVVSCSGSQVVGRGPTEADAWQDFWAAVRASWKPPQKPAGLTAQPGDRLPPRRLAWRKVRTIRVRVFG
ncbi:hypothetical protein ACIHFC_36970 [Streptomyces sp. NPDC052013]|uniref:hypothetical protein n=1 Tax=Streptomyces sp. NPDC052013 TaxID=3365679 RepID=UPI0037D6F5A0